MKRILCILALCLAGTAAFAADVQWTNTAASSGDFNLAANWLNATMPGAADDITWYEYYGPPSLNFYQVTLNVSAGGTFTRWDQDYWYTVVDLNLNGNTLVFYPSGDFGFGVAAYGSAAVTNRVYGAGNINTRSLVVGGSWQAVSSPYFELSGAGTRMTTGDGAGYIGNDSRVRIHSGAVFSNDTSWATVKIGTGGTIASGPMHAIVTLTDPGTRWDNSGLLTVGYVKGDGTLIVTNGAAYKGGNNVSLGGWQYMYDPVADHKNKGTIRVTGSGSTFETTAGRVDVGLLATGRVESVQGGSFTAPSMRLGVGYSEFKPPYAGTDEDGTNTYAYGSALADELGLIDVRGDVTVGVLGKGDVTAANNGEIYIGGNLGVNTGGKVTVSDGYISAGMSEMSGSLLRLELGAKDPTAYYLMASGGLTLSDVDLEIDLLGNFSASNGDTIKLLSYGGLTGSFNGWSDGATFTRDVYEFTYNQTDSEAYLTVTAIPEPASILLLASGIVAAFKLRRRA